MIGEMQPAMELLEIVAFICLFSLEAGSSIPSATRIYVFNTASLGFMRSSKFFLKETVLRN